MDWTLQKKMTQFGRSLTPIIFFGIIGLPQRSYYNKTKRKNKKGLESRHA